MPKPPGGARGAQGEAGTLVLAETETRVRAGANKIGNRPPNTLRVPAVLRLWGSRHKGNWIREGRRSRKDLGPQRRQVTGPAPQRPPQPRTRARVPSPRPQGARNPAARRLSNRNRGVGPLPSGPGPNRGRGARSPLRLLRWSSEGSGQRETGWGVGRRGTSLPGDQRLQQSAEQGGFRRASRVISSGPGGRARGVVAGGQGGGPGAQAPPPGPAPSRSRSAFAATCGRGGARLFPPSWLLPFPSSPPPPVLPPPPSHLPAHSSSRQVPRPSRRLCPSPALGLAAPLGEAVAGTRAMDRVTTPPARLAT